jgi:hypothetical protein
MLHLKPRICNMNVSIIIQQVTFCIFTLLIDNTNSGTIRVPINFTEIINIFPTTYFIKIYFETIHSESLSHSGTPLTLLAYNVSNNFNDRAKFWCRFFPFRSFIGFRSANTVNLIQVNVTRCHESRHSNILNRKNRRFECDILKFVGGYIDHGNEVKRRCHVDGDQMYTLFFVSAIEQYFERQHAFNFWINLGSQRFPNYALVVYSSPVEHLRTVCAFAVRGKDASLYCETPSSISKAILRKEPYLSKSWSTGMEFEYLPNQYSDISTLRDTYLYLRVDDFLCIEVLRRANESGQRYDRYSGTALKRSMHMKHESVGQYMTVDDSSTLFLSCYVKPLVKFGLYFKPFDLEVWISIALCCSIITLFIYVYNWTHKLSKSFNPFFFFVSTLFEEPYSVPLVFWNNRIFKTLTITWLLTAVIFTNLYIGLMVSDVTAPLQGETLSSFDQVLNVDKLNVSDLREDMHRLDIYWYRIRSKVDPETKKLSPCEGNFNAENFEIHQAKFQDKEAFVMLSGPIESCLGKEPTYVMQKQFRSHPKMYSEFNNIGEKLSRYTHRYEDPIYARRLLGFLSPTQRHYPLNPAFEEIAEKEIHLYLSAAIEKELVACQKSIFVGQSNDLTYELSYLKDNYPRKTFYISIGTFENKFRNSIVWRFWNAGKSKVPYYFHRLIEAGIHDGVSRLRKYLFYHRRRSGTKLVQQTLSNDMTLGITGSIQTIFFVWLGGLAVAAIKFVMEILQMKQIFVHPCETIFRHVKSYPRVFRMHFKLPDCQFLNNWSHRAKKA